jgi:hypothetical protein
MTKSDSGFPLDGPVADLEPNRTRTNETGIQTAHARDLLGRRMSKVCVPGGQVPLRTLFLTSR